MTKALRFFAVLLIAVPLFAQSQSQRTYSQPELDQMLAPVALYPDALLSQVLMAATYPLEVVEAAHWTRANPGLQGDAAVRAMQNQDWDSSVISLVAFPQVLQRMDEQLDWTRTLGDAFLAQEPQVMDTVQQLRRRARAAGNLQSGEQIHVEQQGATIVVQPASPQYVYVPYYDPLVVYGPWWWPAYRPVYWAPWPGYARHYRSGVSVGFWWGTPVGLSVNFFFGNVDWHQRHVRVVHPTAYYYRRPMVVNRTVAVERDRWQHDTHHRRGVDYRTPEVRQRFAGAPAERRDAQRQDLRQVQTPRSRGDAQAAERTQHERQRRQVDPVRAQQQQRRQQVEAARAQPPRQEQRTAIPAAQAPQQPRADRQEQRQDRREQRRDRDQRG